MRLPSPPDRYARADQAALRRALEDEVARLRAALEALEKRVQALEP